MAAGRSWVANFAGAPCPLGRRSGGRDFHCDEQLALFECWSPMARAGTPRWAGSGATHPRPGLDRASVASRYVGGCECGSAKHRLPPSVPTVRTRMLATAPLDEGEQRPGGSRTAAERSIVRCVAVGRRSGAPPPLSTDTPPRSGMRLMSTRCVYARQAQLEQQQQLGATGVDFGVVSTARAAARSLPAASSADGGWNGASRVTRTRAAKATASGRRRTASDAIAASMPAPRDTVTPRSANVRPTAAVPRRMQRSRGLAHVRCGRGRRRSRPRTAGPRSAPERAPGPGRP